MKKIVLSVFLLLIIIISDSYSAPSIKEGDTVKFWSVSYIDWMKVLPKQPEITAVCRKVGNLCYVFIDTSDHNSISQTLIDLFAKKFDNEYQKLTGLYGPIPDALDKDPRVYILGITDTWWGGYFDPTHQMPDTMVNRIWGVHSSEKEIIFLKTNEFTPIGVSALAHEFGHLIHWGQDHSPEPADNPKIFWEEAWVDEGFSTFAEIYLTEDISAIDKIFYEAFFCVSNNISLIHFENYSSSRLFMLYMYEHYGKDNYIKTLIKNQDNGIKGVQSTLKQLGYDIEFNDVFRDWSIANYIDLQGFDNNKYYYSLYNFNQRKNRFTMSSYPGIFSDSLKSYASEYILLSNIKDNNLKVSFKGQAGSKFKASLIFQNKDSNNTVAIKDITLDAANNGEFVLNTVKENYNQVILVAMNVDSNIGEGQKAWFQCTCEESKTSVESGQNNELRIEKDYINNHLTIYGAESSVNPIKAELFDISGSLLQKRVSFDYKCSIDTTGLGKGLYFLKIESMGKRLIKSIFL